MRLTYILAIILIMIFSMGAQCTSNKAEDVVDAPFYGGIEGVVVNFMDYSSVSDTSKKYEVWEDEDFPIEIEVLNKGEYTLEANDIEFDIKGISPNDFSGIDFSKTNSNKIEKVSQFMPDGGVDYVNFGDAHYSSLTGTHYDANIFVYFTYPYKTYINIPKVCYKENIKDQTVCTVDTTKQAFASGGPIQVGTVTQRYIGKGKILLEIPIKNVGKGRAKSYSNDDFEVNYDKIGFRIDDPDWDCSARGNPTDARISHPSGQPGNEDVVIRCINSNLEEGALYTKAVTLVLDYYYQDWVEQRVRIVENPE